MFTVISQSTLDPRPATTPKRRKASRRARTHSLPANVIVLHGSACNDLTMGDQQRLRGFVQALPGANWWTRVFECDDGSRYMVVGNSRWSDVEASLMIAADRNGYTVADMRADKWTRGFTTLKALGDALPGIAL